MMKISKWEGAILSLAALFFAFSAGWIVRGGQGAQPVRIETQHRLDTAAVQAMTTPAPERLNINTATAQELMTLPGIGEKRAADILADRAANGNYRYPEELTRISGIGEETVAALADYITVEEEQP